MQLRAISEKGEQSTFAVTCTVDAPENCPCTTPSDCLGAFELRAPSVAQSFTLKLQPFAGTGSLQPDSTTQAPSLICSGLDLANDPDVVAGQRASVALGDVQLPAFPLATRYQISVVEDDDDPISGAQVTFSDTALKVAHLPQGFAKCEASYERSVITKNR